MMTLVSSCGIEKCESRSQGLAQSAIRRAQAVAVHIAN